MSWPVSGDQAVFRRRMATLLGSGTMLIATSVAVAGLMQPSLVRPVIPLAASALLLTLLWAHGAARTAARRREIERSFAGLTVLHHGEAYDVTPGAPVLGSYASRRHAARAALERGSWALIVHAWDRWYLLDARPSQGSAPVSFRSRAVADVVPAIRVGA